MESKKYTKIIRFGKNETLGILEYLGSTIVVQEKLDGANASFTLENGQLIAYSRRMKLDQENDLRGFYSWVHTIDHELLNNNYLYFGEWLVKHKIDYGKHMNQFYLFDVYDKTQERYVHFEIVKQEARRIGLNLIPVFYEGEAVSLDQLQAYVGLSKLGTTGEGIVIKNIDYTYKGRQVYTKIVNDNFREIKIKTPKKKLTKTKEGQFIDQFLTEARIEKMLFNLMDEKIIDENFEFKDKGTILKHLNVRLYEDLLEEEEESLGEEFDPKLLRQLLSKTVSSSVKKIMMKNRK